VKINFKHQCIFPLLLGLTSFSVFSRAYPSLQLGIYGSNITYTEPDVMQEEGELFGLMGRFIYTDQYVSRTLEATYASGDMDYDGSGTIKDIPDEIFEIRGLVSRDLAYINDYKVSPYVGLGYRYLNDDSSGLVSSTGASGYEREQSYLYMPIGVEFQKRTPINGWLLSTKLEYDYFIAGENTTHLSDVDGNDDIELTQDEGYGHRISISFSKDFRNGMILSIEPFYKYWHIADSDIVYDSTRGKYWVEPDNNSEEFGIAFLFRL